jgi:hypothetical protein
VTELLGYPEDSAGGIGTTESDHGRAAHGGPAIARLRERSPIGRRFTTSTSSTTRSVWWRAVLRDLIVSPRTADPEFMIEDPAAVEVLADATRSPRWSHYTRLPCRSSTPPDAWSAS